MPYYLQAVLCALIFMSSTFVFAQTNANFESETISDPVLFMKTNSTAEIFMKWNPYHLSSGTYNVTKEIYRTNSDDPNPIQSSDLTINSVLSTINLNTSSTIVTYTITAKNNIKGIYDIPLRFCGGYSPLLVIGLNESEVDPLIFYNYFAALPTCPAYTPPADQTIINYSGIISKDITVDITKIPPLKQIEGFVKGHDIICKHGFVHLKKFSDNSPACVKPQTAQKLVERGWGKSMVQTTWFELNPIKCHAPWDEYWFKKSPTANTTIATTPSMIINYYFKNNGITLFETRESPTLHTVPPPCGQPAEETYYFLVSESDVDKMVKLGYKMLENQPPPHLIELN